MRHTKVIKIKKKYYAVLTLPVRVGIDVINEGRVLPDRSKSEVCDLQNEPRIHDTIRGFEASVRPDIRMMQERHGREKTIKIFIC